MRAVIAVLGLICLVGCATDNCCSKRHVEDLTAMPVEPKWREIGNPPIIAHEPTDKSYKVSDEFVERGIQGIEWSNQVRRWRAENRIP